MATINDATVVASAYTTMASARPQRLSNGWLVAVSLNGNVPYLYVSKDNATWSQFCTLNQTALSISISVKGTDLYIIASAGAQTIINFWKIDALTQTNVAVTQTSSIDTAQTALGNVSLAINDTGTELHATWASKNATYPNSFNIRYEKGTINADGSVTWGAVQQVTINNTTGQDNRNPSIIIKGNGYPAITWEYQFASGYMIMCNPWNGTAWAGNYAVINTTYTQASPSAIFVPQSINGLANGRIWVAWHGVDSTDTGAYNIRVAYSDDGGVTWSAMQKLTSGNTSSKIGSTITANKNNRIDILCANYSDADVYKLTNTNGTWSNPLKVTNTGLTNNYAYPSVLFDLTMNISEPLFIYKGNAKVGFYGTWTTTNISVTQGSIGTKSDKNNLLSYSITTDGTMGTITESVNGTVVGTKNINSGDNTIAGLTQAQWDAIKYGKYKDVTGGLNTLTVSMGSDVFTYTFDKRLATTDDLLSAVKSVQDANGTYLPAVKAKLGSAIRGKGGTVNDTDSWDLIKTAIDGITLGVTGGKRWANGTTMAGGTLAVRGLAFTPSVFIAKATSNDNTTVGNGTYSLVYVNKSLFAFVNDIAFRTGTSTSIASAPATLYADGVEMTPVTASVNYAWIAFE